MRRCRLGRRWPMLIDPRQARTGKREQKGLDGMRLGAFPEVLAPHAARCYSFCKHQEQA